MADFKSQLTVALVFSIWLKLMTFILTMYLTRLLSPEYSGVNFTYSVFIEAILFVAREAPQNTALRYNLTKDDSNTDSTTENNITSDNDVMHNAHNDCHEDDTNVRDDGNGEDDNTLKSSSLQAEQTHEQHDNKKDCNNASKHNFNSISHRAMIQQINFSFVSIPLAIICICLCELQTLTPLQLFPALSSMWSSSTSITGATNTTTINNTITYNTSNIKKSNSEFYQGSWIMNMMMTTTMVTSELLARLPELAVYLSVCLFALAQPAMVLLQSLDIYRANVLAEFWTTVVRLMTTIVLITINHHGIHSDWEGRMIFAFSHLASAFTFVLYYVIVSAPLSSEVVEHKKENVNGTENIIDCKASTEQTSNSANKRKCLSVWRRCISHAPFPWNEFDEHVMWVECQRNFELFYSFLTESLAHITLDESEKFAIAALGDTKARGYYETVSSIGSIAVRLVYCVWERACLAKWSREISSGAYTEAVTLLLFMLRLALYLGYVFILIGPLVSAMSLEILYSRRWAIEETITSLQLFFYNLPCIGVSGLLETFLRSAASPELLRRYQRCTFIHSALFLLTCFVGLSVYKSEKSNMTRRLIALGIGNHLCRSACALYFIESVTIDTSNNNHNYTDDGSCAENNATTTTTTTTTNGKNNKDNIANNNKCNSKTSLQKKLVDMRLFATILPWQTAVGLALLFVISRILPLTFGLFITLCVAFCTCVIVFDNEMRSEVGVIYKACFASKKQCKQ